MNNFALRAISGSLYVALIVCSLIFSDLYFCILCLIFGLFASVEFNYLMARSHTMPLNGDSQSGAQPKDSEPQFGALTLDVFGIIALTIPCVLSAWTSYNTLPSLWGSGGALLIYGIAGMLLWLFYIVLRMLSAIYQREGSPVKNLAFSMLGQLYIGMGLVSAQLLSLQSAGLVLLVFILIWINDTGAFLVGSAIGKRKLFPRLSPGKSWEGFLGGMFSGIAVSIVLLHTGVTYRLMGFPILGPWEVAFGLPIVVGAAGTLGDLFESMLKRSVKAKDSGTLIPGHGGILDRIDSMLFAMPAVILFIFLCGLING